MLVFVCGVYCVVLWLVRCDGFGGVVWIVCIGRPSRVLCRFGALKLVC